MAQTLRSTNGYDSPSRPTWVPLISKDSSPPPVLLSPRLSARLEPPDGHQLNGHVEPRDHDKEAGPSKTRGIEVDLYAVPETEADYLKGNPCIFQEIQRKSGAEIQFASTPSGLRGWNILIIRGYRRQIRTAVRLVCRKTGNKGTISAQSQAFWVEWIESAFPDLGSRAYFMPPVSFNRPQTKKTQEIFEQDGKTNGLVHVTKTCSPSVNYQNETATPPIRDEKNGEVRDDAALQRVLYSLQRLSEDKREVLFGLNTLRFGQYMGKPCYLAAATHLPQPAGLPLPKKWRKGNFDALLIHRHYGIVLLEVRAFGEDLKKSNNLQNDTSQITDIRQILREAAIQLNKAAAILSHILSETVPGLRISKAIAVPNLTVGQVEQALAGAPQLTQDLCHCLGTDEPKDIPGLCLCYEQLIDPKTPRDIGEDELTGLRGWWQRRVVRSRPEIQMTFDMYKTLVARFCGPAITVTVPRTTSPILGFKTLDQAVSLTGEYSIQVTLYPEQAYLVNAAPPRVFIAGPPGTGKTVVLLLEAAEWLRFGSDVYVVSSWTSSQVACNMARYLLQQTINTQLAAAVVKHGQVHLLQYDFYEEKQVEKAVEELEKLAKDGSLYVIADEAGPDDMPQSEPFQTFCEKLLARVPGLHLWAASCYTDNAPEGWQLEYFTRPLRFPSVVAREVAMANEITRFRVVKTYNQQGVPDHRDGPPVKILYHRRQGHFHGSIIDCIECGREVASFLHSLRIGVQDDPLETLPPSLQYKDVLIPLWVDASDTSRMLVGLQEADIPVRVMTDMDAADVATGRSDVVWAARGDRVCGLERKVVVCLEEEFGLRDYYVRLHFMSRCTSQLVLISWKPPEGEYHTPICDLVQQFHG